MEENRIEENTPFPAPLLFNELIEIMRRYVYFKDHRYYLLLGVYTFLTYLYPIFERFPNIFIFGTGDGSESTAGKLLSIFSHNSRVIGYFNLGLILRFIKQEALTLFIDNGGFKSIEKDLATNQLLCNGNKKSGSAMVCNESGKIETFSTSCPIVIISREGINAPAIERNVIKVQTQKSPLPLERFFFSEAKEKFKGIKNETEKFCEENQGAIEKEYHKFSRLEGLEGNDEELWMPLLSIAKVLDPLINKTSFIFNQLVRLAKETTQARVKEKLFNNIETQCLHAALNFIKENDPLEDGSYVAEELRDYIRIQWDSKIETKRVLQILRKNGAIQDQKVSWVTLNNGKEPNHVQRTCFWIKNQALGEALGDVLNLVN